MMYIGLGTDEQATWYLGQPNPCRQIQLVNFVQADQDELRYILRMFRNLPRPKESSRCVRWYGDDARFIVGNLPDPDE